MSVIATKCFRALIKLYPMLVKVFNYICIDFFLIFTLYYAEFGTEKVISQNHKSLYQGLPHCYVSITFFVEEINLLSNL